VTGGAQGITAEIVHHMASKRGGVFHLLGRTELPDREPEALPDNEADAKRQVMAALQESSDGKVTPGAVNTAVKQKRARRSIWETLQRLGTLPGVSAHYHAADVTDTARIDTIVSQVLKTHDHIDWLIHAAGLEISHPIERKDLDEFERVMRPKTVGLENLLSAIGDASLGSVVTFGSIAGRFGNPTQTDYSSANEWMAWRLARLTEVRPDVRTLQIDWTAWAGAGMATRGSVTKVLEAAGIGFLSLDAGATVFRRLLEERVRGEVVVDCGLGMLEPEAVDDRMPPPPLLFGEHSVVSVEDARFQFSWPLDVSASWMNDHRINGTPVLPGVMGLEAFGQASLALLPGARVRGFEGVSFETPLKLHGDRSHRAIIEAIPQHPSLMVDGNTRVHCRLLSRFVGPSGEEQGPQRLHFVGTVVMDNELVPIQPVRPNGSPIDAQADIKGQGLYDVLFHGPSFQVLTGTEPYQGGLRASVDDERLLLPVMERASAPMELEALFQTVGVLEIIDDGTMGLPSAARSVRIYGIPGRGITLECFVERESGAEGYSALLRDSKGRVFVELNGYQTISLE
jgi:NAD(P)-dependent dehydrogenase (short-subunit alcohol dehydrogenase family)